MLLALVLRPNDAKVGTGNRIGTGGRLRLLSESGISDDTGLMEIRNIIALQEAWQQQVSAHAAFLRDARAAKMTAQEIHKRGRIHLLRIDATFAKLKAAEQYGRQTR